MAIRQSRGRWTVEFQQGGSRVFKRLPPGITKAQAQEYEVKLRRGIFDSERLGRKPDITLTDAIGRWLLENHRKDQRKAKSEAKQWEPFVKGKFLRQGPEVAQAAVQKWTLGASRTPSTARRDAQPQPSAVSTDAAIYSAPATINRRLAMLKAVCKHAYKTGLIADNLSGRITMLKGEKMRERYLTKQEVSRIAGCAPSSACKAATMLLAYSGLRVSEFLGQTGLTSRSATFVVPQSKSKTDKPRLVPIATPARPYLRMWLDSQQPDYFALRKQFIEACKKAEVKGVRIHDLRHTAASWLINSGVDLYTVGKILGHSGPQTTARYAHLAKDTLERAMSRLK